MFDLTSLNYFRHVARNPNISAVAEQLHITQPALSKSLSKLEKTLNYPLFDRDHGRIFLNSNGEIFLDCVDRIFMQLEDGLAQLRDASQQGYGYISYATNIPTALERVIPPYAERNPLFHVAELQEPLDILTKQLINNEIDFAVTTSIPRDGKILGIPILREKIFLVTARSDDMPDRASVRLSDMVRYPFLCDEMEISRSQIHFFCQQAGVEPDIRWVSCDGRIIEDMLHLGGRIALLPAHNILHMKHYGDYDDYQVYEVEDASCGLTINILKRKDHHFSAACQSYYDYLLNVFQLLSHQWPEAIQFL